MIATRLKTSPYLSRNELAVLVSLVATSAQAQSLAGGYSDAVGLGAMGGLVLLLLAWTHSLRRRLRGAQPSALARKGGAEVFGQENGGSDREDEREFFRALLEHTLDCIYFKDRQSRFLRCSKAMCQRFGVTQQGVVGKTDFYFFDDSHARQAFADEQEMLRTGQAFHAKVEREVWQDGKERWALTSKMPLRNTAGEIIGTFGISKDITDLKATETQLAHERDLLGTLLDHTPDLIYFKDLQSRFVRVSRSMVESSLALACAKHQESRDDKGAGDLPAHLAGPAEFAPYLLGKTDFDIHAEDRARWPSRMSRKSSAPARRWPAKSKRASVPTARPPGS